MRKGIVIAAVAVAVGVGIASFASLWQGATQSGLPVAAVLPEGTLYWAEARDLRGLVHGVRGSAAWRDLQQSGLLEFAEMDSASAWTDEVAAVSEKIGYDIDEANALKFLGAEAAVAVWLDSAAEPHATLVTRVDGEALAKDLLTGELDWSALQDELTRRVELAEVVVTTEEHAGYAIATATRGESTIYAALLEDLLVLSDAREGVVSAVDLRVAGGQGSLDRLPAFKDEIARLPSSAPLLDWIHVEAVKTATVGWPGRPDRPIRLRRALDGISAPAVARAIELPEHDLYRLDWTWSRSDADMFADTATPSIREIVPPGAIVHIEGQRLGQLGEAWNASPIKAHLADSWVARKLEEAFESAKTALKDSSITGPNGDPSEASSTEFVERFGTHMVGRVVDSALGSDAAITVWWREGATVPALLISVRLGTDGRMLELLTRAAGDAASGERQIESIPHGGRTILGKTFAEAGGSAYFVAAGDLLLCGTDLEILKDALDRVDGRTAPTAETITAAAGDLPDDYRVLVAISPQAYVAAVADLARATSDPDAESASELMRASLPYEALAIAVYAADDLSQVDVRMRASVLPGQDDLMSAWKNVARGAPRSFDVLPEGLLWAYASRADIPTAIGVLRTRDFGPLGPVIGDGIRQFEEALEVRIDDVLPALGDEIAFALSFEDQPAQPDMPAIPGLAVLVSVRDRGPVVDLLDNLARVGREALAESPSAPEIVRGSRDGAPEYRLVEDPRQRQVPVVPTVAFVGDFLAIALDTSTIDELCAVRDGQERAHSAGDLYTRIRATGLPVDGNETIHVDWGRVLDQVAVYAPQIGELVAMVGSEGRVPPPEFPDDGDAEEWQRRVVAYQAAQAEAAENASRGKVDDVIGVIDSLRFLDFSATVSSVEGDVLRSHMIIRFRR